MIRFKKNIFLSLILGASSLFCISTALADKAMTLPTFIPVKNGNYKSVNLINQKFLNIDRETLVNECTTANNGMLSVTKGGELLYCNFDGTLTYAPGVWKAKGTNDYLTELDYLVGIGTSTPLAKLHVEGGNVLFEGEYTGNPPAPLPPDWDTVYSPKLSWDPGSSSFRAGATSWDEYANGGTDGNYSMAMGKDLSATGQYSGVLGGEIGYAQGDFSVWAGVRFNTGYCHNGLYSTMIGGEDRSCAGWYYNSSGGNYSAIFHNYSERGGQIYGDYSTSLGGSLMISYSQPEVVQRLTQSNTTIIHGFRNGINTPSPISTLDVKGLIKFGNVDQKRFPIGIGREEYAFTAHVWLPRVNGPICQNYSTYAPCNYTSSSGVLELWMHGLYYDFKLLDPPGGRIFGGTDPPHVMVTIIADPSSGPIIPIIHILTDDVDKAYKARVEFYNIVTQSYVAPPEFKISITGNIDNGVDGMNTKVGDATLPYYGEGHEPVSP